MQNSNQFKLQQLFFVSSTFKFTVTLMEYTSTQCQTMSCNYHTFCSLCQILTAPFCFTVSCIIQ